MAPFTKPETVLKHAEGLVSVGQSNAALQSLTEMFSSKRFRSTPLTSLEPIMLRFVELCVNMRRGRTAKEGLMQYKNIAQNSSVTSIEVVIKKFISLADAKVTEAQEQADKVVAVDVDDLEASETPEDVLLGAVSGDQNKDRTDRALVTPWLKFSWESYRTALETLKNNARLELVYQQIALQAFKFCLKHSRKVEFRRLCETLRLHLANVAKYSGQAHSINLSDPDTLQRHLDTRFAQLNASVELELWQEAFRSVEDIHNLLTLAKKAPRPAMMANYYEKLARIFLTSGNALYHAAAWSRYYSVIRAVGGKSEEEMVQLAGLVLVSALAIPVSLNDGEDEEVRGKSARLTALLGLSKPPTRSGLLREALLRNTLAVSSTEIRSLYQTLEVDLHPLTICSSIAPIFKSLASGAFAPYLSQLNKVLLSRLLSQLSQVYSSVKIDYILDLVKPLNEPYSEVAPAVDGEEAPKTVQPEVWNATTLEAFIVSAARRGELSVRIDHTKGSIAFTADVFGVASTSAAASTSSAGLTQLQSSPAELIRTRFSRLATALSNSLLQLYPPPPPPSAEEQFASLVKAAEEERRRLVLRRTMLTRRTELHSELVVRKEKEEAARKAEASRKEKEEEAKRAAALFRQREAERIKNEIEKTNREEALAMAKQLAEKTHIKIDLTNIENLDTSKIVAMQVDQLDKEKRDLNERLRVYHKRIDHLERAMRKEERPLLAQDYEQQKAQDLAAYTKNKAETLVAAKQKHAENLATKARLARLTGDYQAFRKEVAGKREDEFERKRAEAKALIEQEKEARRKAVFAEREAERKAWDAEQAAIRAQEEEEERLAAEQAAEEERLRAEEEAALAKAAEAKKAAQEKLAEEARKRDTERAKLDEQARRQREREEEAERRAAERAAQRSASQRNGTASSTSGSGASPAGGAWRSSRLGGTATPPSNNTPPGSLRGTPTATVGNGGSYRPPGARGLGGASSADSSPFNSTRGTPTSGSRPSIFGSNATRQTPPSSTPGSPAPEKKDAASSEGKWRPTRRGPGEAPPR